MENKKKLRIFRASNFFRKNLPIEIRRQQNAETDLRADELVNRREFWIILYVLSGTGEILINNRSYPFGAGFVALLHPNDRTNLKVPSPIKLYQVLFLQNWIAPELKRLSRDRFFGVFDSTFRPDWSLNHEQLHLLDGSRRIRRQIEAMLHEYDHDDDKTPEMLRYMLLELLLRLARLGERKLLQTRRNSTAGFIDRYLADHYGDRIDCAELAGELGIGKDYLFKLYRRQTGGTIGETLMEIRLRNAAEMLRNSKADIRHIAAVCGFADPTNFYRYFRRRFNASPGEYRENNGLRNPK